MSDNDIENQTILRLRKMVDQLEEIEIDEAQNARQSIHLDLVCKPTHYKSPSDHIYSFPQEQKQTVSDTYSPSSSPPSPTLTKKITKLDLLKKVKYYRLSNVSIIREKTPYFNMFATFGFIGSGTWILSSKGNFYSLVTWLTVIFACYIFYLLKNLIICGYTDDAIKESKLDSLFKQDNNLFLILQNNETVLISAISVNFDNLNNVQYNGICTFPDFCHATLIEKNNQTYIRIINLYKNHKLSINMQNIYVI